MPKVLRIMNRGTCPRLMLELFGATNKRDKMHDPKVIGLNGTGTKYAPAAAYRLQIGVAVTSTDEHGSYWVWYDTEEITLQGAARRRMLMRYDGKTTVPMQVTTDIGRVWDQPIGSDDKTAYRVVREFEANAADEDAHYSVTVIDESEMRYAPPGCTVVYLTWHDDFQDMLFDRSERWFKGIGSPPPLFAVPGIGAIYSKSDDAHTRVFCQGRIAYCVEHKTLSSELDWSVDDKRMLSEDREFREAGKFHEVFNGLMCRLTDVALAKRILKAAIERPSSLEGLAIGQVGHLNGAGIETSAVWLRAWHDLYDGPNGEEAIISSGHEGDQTAIHAFNMRPVSVSDRVRSFLTRCGVSESDAYLPAREDTEEIRPDAGQLVRLGRLTQAVRDEYKDHPDQTVRERVAGVQFYFYCPMTPKGEGFMGLTDVDEHGHPIGRLGINARLSGSWTDIVDTALHELTHMLVPTREHGLPFVDHQDRDRGRMFRERHGLPHEPPAATQHALKTP